MKLGISRESGNFTENSKILFQTRNRTLNLKFYLKLDIVLKTQNYTWNEK